MELAGKVAIITGAGGGGTGRAVARRMARDGAAVVACDVNVEAAQATARMIAASGGRAAALRTDVGVEAEVDALFEFAARPSAASTCWSTTPRPPIRHRG